MYQAFSCRQRFRRGVLVAFCISHCIVGCRIEAARVWLSRHGIASLTEALNLLDDMIVIKAKGPFGDFDVQPIAGNLIFLTDSLHIFKDIRQLEIHP